MTEVHIKLMAEVPIKSMDWFGYDGDLRRERVKSLIPPALTSVFLEEIRKH